MTIFNAKCYIPQQNFPKNRLQMACYLYASIILLSEESCKLCVRHKTIVFIWYVALWKVHFCVLSFLTDKCDCLIIFILIVKKNCQKLQNIPSNEVVEIVAGKSWPVSFDQNPNFAYSTLSSTRRQLFTRTLLDGLMNFDTMIWPGCCD